MSRPIAVITGASSGIGAATAVKMAPQWNLCLIARRTDRLLKLVEEIRGASSSCEVAVVALDVTDEKAVDAALAAELPPVVDCLVNCAGLAKGTELAEKCQMADWGTMIETNVQALCKVTLGVLARMPDGGSIINVGSTAGTWPYLGGNVYGASKAFVRQFSDNLRIDLQQRRIRVTDIQPGIVQTEFSIVRYRGDVAAAKKVYENRVHLTPEDVGRSIAWVAGLPERVCVGKLEIVPVTQAYAGFR